MDRVFKRFGVKRFFSSPVRFDEIVTEEMSNLKSRFLFSDNCSDRSFVRSRFYIRWELI